MSSSAAVEQELEGPTLDHVCTEETDTDDEECEEVTTTTTATVSLQPLQWHDEEGVVSTLVGFLPVSSVVRSQRVNKKWQELCKKAIEKNFQPKKEFQDGDELREVAKKYYEAKYGMQPGLGPHNNIFDVHPKYNKEDVDEIGATYGFQ